MIERQASMAAAKSLRESLLRVGIREEIRKALCVGPMFELVARIDASEEKIIEKIEQQLRDYFAHEAQCFDYRAEIKGIDAKASEFFEQIFKDVKAWPDEH